MISHIITSKICEFISKFNSETQHNLKIRQAFINKKIILGYLTLNVKVTVTILRLAYCHCQFITKLSFFSYYQPSRKSPSFLKLMKKTQNIK